MYQHQAGGYFNDTFEYRLWKDPKEAKMSQRSNVSLLETLHKCTLQGWAEKQMCQKQG